MDRRTFAICVIKIPHISRRRIAVAQVDTEASRPRSLRKSVTARNHEVVIRGVELKKRNCLCRQKPVVVCASARKLSWPKLNSTLCNCIFRSHALAAYGRLDIGGREERS